MSIIPENLYRAAQVRELDRIAIEDFKLAGMTLMERAGQAAFNALRLRWPRTRSVAVLCGAGNNGGDGYVVARLADMAGIRVMLYQVGDHSRLKGDALTARERLEGTHVDIHPFSDSHFLQEFDVVVDGLLGTGLSGEVRADWRTAIEAINEARGQRPHAQQTKVLALDIPSGLHADTGAVLGSAVQADVTVTFIGMKQGLLTGAGPGYCGDIVFNDLQVPGEVYSNVPVDSRRIQLENFAPLLPARSRAAHKGYFGHVLVMGGNLGMSGAVHMAAEAAGRVGSGLVSVATRAEHAALVNLTRPELMCHGINDRHDLMPLLQKATVLAVGPGLGQDRWAQELLAAALDCDLPMVVDADALNLLAQEPARSDRWIMTPHPGEAARLLGCSAQAVQADRFAAAIQLQARYGGICVLKGAGTLVVASPQDIPALCNAGNPGMASGGMGDVLTGVIAGLLAQGLSPGDAAQMGVCLHATAADNAARQGERGLLASDLLPPLQRLVNKTNA
jgi:hydroxyethylthiazole kinase-like uncharacterized protein yjeF